MLINFNKNEYFLNNKNNEERYVYSLFCEFPKFGNDLIIHSDGAGDIFSNSLLIRRC